MSDEEIRFFVSYAREDSQFTLKLANDLRVAGIKLWLDQLDIRGGDRWDRAVEKALETCEGLLVILSPDAVVSDNVMDEVAYALEERKKVIPVISRECEIPFRLRRFHYIDFTDADQKAAFANLHAALRIEPPHVPGDTLHASTGANDTSRVNIRDLPIEERRAEQVDAAPEIDGKGPGIESRGMREQKWLIQWRRTPVWLVPSLLGCLALLALFVARQHVERASPTPKPEPVREPMKGAAKPAAAPPGAPVVAIVLKIRGVGTEPNQVTAGQSVGVEMEYEVLAPSGANLAVREAWELWKDNQFLKAVQTEEVSREPGTWRASASIPVPKEAPPGTYVVKTRVETGKIYDERETHFVVSR